LTLRGIVFTPAGTVRALWRALLFVGLLWLFYTAAFAAFFFIGRPSSSALFQVEAYLVILAVVWLAHYVMLRWVDHASWSYVGLARAQLQPRLLALGLALGGLCILIPSGGLLLANELTIVTGLQGAHSWPALAVGGAVLFLPQALGEEMMARGYLFAAVRDALGWPAALAATSIGFGLMHSWNPGADPESITLVVLAGVFLGAVLVATRSLYAAWMAHFAWNWSMSAILHTAVSGVQFPYSTYRIVDGGPDWLTGGSWGPEGGAAAAAGMLAGIAVLVAWRREQSRAAITRAG
jgi:uncharacterized protein